ncbi:MAG: hypothetical protein KDA86_22415 [Planctomycetaceae bacterium]|nr:hypothetical protein [Planctomycetaceae bacterium]
MTTYVENEPLSDPIDDDIREQEHLACAAHWCDTKIELEMHRFYSDELFGVGEERMLYHAEQRFNHHYGQLNEESRARLLRQVDDSASERHGDEWEVFKLNNMDDLFERPDIEAVKRVFFDLMLRQISLKPTDDMPRRCLDQAAAALAVCHDPLPPERAEMLGLADGATFANAVALKERSDRQDDERLRQSKIGPETEENDPEIDEDFKKKIEEMERRFNAEEEGKS